MKDDWGSGLSCGGKDDSIQGMEDETGWKRKYLLCEDTCNHVAGFGAVQ